MKLVEVKRYRDPNIAREPDGTPFPGKLEELPKAVRMDVRKILFALSPFFEITEMKPVTGPFKEYFRARGHHKRYHVFNFDVRTWPDNEDIRDSAFIHVTVELATTNPTLRAEIVDTLKTVFPSGPQSYKSSVPTVINFKKRIPLEAQ